MGFQGVKMTKNTLILRFLVFSGYKTLYIIRF